MSVRPVPRGVPLSGRQETTGEPDPETLRLRMREIRNELQSDVDEVVDRAGELTDWRYYVRTYPWVSVAVAAAVGYWLVPKLSGGGQRRSSADGRRSSGDGMRTSGGRKSSGAAADRGRSRSANGRSSEGRSADGGGSSEGRSAEGGGSSGSEERGWLGLAVAMVAPVLVRAGTTYLSHRIVQAFEDPSSRGQSAGEGVSSPGGRAERVREPETEMVPRDITSGGEF